MCWVTFPRWRMTILPMESDLGVKECTAIFSVTYVSESTIPASMVGEEIAGLVALSRERNSATGLTGCLVFSGSHFAQMLEGPEKQVHRLMKSIERDPRHRRIEVVEATARNARRCGDWALGYSGPSRFVQRVIKRSLEERHSEAALRDLVDLLTGLQTSQRVC